MQGQARLTCWPLWGQPANGGGPALELSWKNVPVLALQPYLEKALHLADLLQPATSTVVSSGQQATWPPACNVGWLIDLLVHTTE